MSVHSEVEARPEARAIARREMIPGIGRAKALFLGAAGVSFLLSVSLYFTGSYQQGIFVGIWVPSILSAGALLLGRERHE